MNNLIITDCLWDRKKKSQKTGKWYQHLPAKSQYPTLVQNHLVLTLNIANV
jgi:hypothetical protein